MWARVVEIMVAVWLALSPFIFRAADQNTILWIDFAAALLIATLAGVSYWAPLKYAHWAILFIAIALVLLGRFSTPPPVSAAHQNHIFIGLLLMLFAIVPNEASIPPPEWRTESKKSPP